MKKYFTKSFLLLLVALFIFVPNSRALENNTEDSGIEEQSIERLIPNDLPTPIFGHKLVGGIGDVTIYIDSVGTPRATYWQRLIKDAVTNWMYTGVGANKFYGSYVTNSSSSKVEIEAVYKGFFGDDKDRVHAGTLHIYQKQLAGNPPKTDWDHAIISLNDDVLRRPSISDAEATGDIIHEFGHVFGLDHNNVNPYSIMHSSSVIDNRTGKEIFRQVHKVQKVDNDAVNRIY